MAKTEQFLKGSFRGRISGQPQIPGIRSKGRSGGVPRRLRVSSGPRPRLRPCTPMPT